jgi:AcrR family transcriptional regulator
VAVAAELVDREGLQQLSLSRVAAAVDRHVSSLYNHVDGVDDLRREIALLTVREVGDVLWRAVLGRSGEDALRSLVTTYREFIVTRQDRWQLVSTAPHTPELRLLSERAFEAIEATVASFGLEAGAAVHAHRILSSAVIGLATRFEPHVRPVDPSIDDTFEMLVVMFAASLPELAKATAGATGAEAAP